MFNTLTHIPQHPAGKPEQQKSLTQTTVSAVFIALQLYSSIICSTFDAMYTSCLLGAHSI